VRSDGIFENLFVLELANNHWGSLDRGKAIVDQFSKVVRYNNVKAAIKLQLRDVDSFIHAEFKDREDLRYVKKTLDTKMSKDDFKALAAYIKDKGCIPSATPFDEASVDFAVELGLPFLKIASSDINDWVLIEKIATTRLPVAVSSGGSSLKDLDDLVSFFNKRDIPLALNHCVSLYPTEDSQLELNQIDFLRDRYPGVVIGLSTHEYHDWSSSIMMAYAKGARTFERHIDIEADGIPVSPYCTLPEQADEWFRSFHKAVEMSGGSGTQRRVIPDAEREYLDQLVRGVYAKVDLKAGDTITDNNVYLAIPLQRGQLSCRELIAGDVLVQDLDANSPLTLSHLDNPYSNNESLRSRIETRGLA